MKKRSKYILAFVLIVSLVIVSIIFIKKQNALLVELDYYKTAYYQLNDDHRMLQNDNEDLKILSESLESIVRRIKDSYDHEKDFVERLYAGRIYYIEDGEKHPIPLSGKIFTESDHLSLYFYVDEPSKLAIEDLDEIISKLHIKRLDKFIECKTGVVSKEDNLVKVTLDLSEINNQTIYLNTVFTNLLKENFSIIHVNHVNFNDYPKGEDYYTNDNTSLIFDQEWIRNNDILEIYEHVDRVKVLYVNEGVYEYHKVSNKIGKQILPIHCIEGMTWTSQSCDFEIVEMDQKININGVPFECMVVKETTADAIYYHYYSLGLGEVETIYKQ